MESDGVHQSVPLDAGQIWKVICQEALEAQKEDTVFARVLEHQILYHPSFAQALALLLSRKLESEFMPLPLLVQQFEHAFASSGVMEASVGDLQAAVERDPACDGFLNPFLFYKGYHALQGYRLAHWLWNGGRRGFARLIQSQISEVFGVDIHPAAVLGKGILMDHATGIVIGETAVVGDNCSMLHGVTLGGTGKEMGNRHPKVGHSVLIGAGAKILGNISIGEHARIAASSVVLSPVEPYTTVAGIPAKPVSKQQLSDFSRTMDHIFE